MEVIVTNGTISVEEQKYYETYIEKNYSHLDIRRVFLTLEGDNVHFSIEPQRHILTKMGGALIGDPLNWNDAKRAEYFDTMPNPL